jgi:hypothetical protein
MKLKLFTNFTLVLLLLNLATAYEIDYTSEGNNNVELEQLKYEPYPVNPGEYFDLWIKVATYDDAQDVSFELIENYPFSLDSNEDAIKTYDDLISDVLLEYKIRVDKDAVEGVNELKLTYDIGNQQKITKTFEIQVANAQTEFDAVIQDIIGSEISIAIANIGEYTANAVVLRIPKQDNFKTIGTDGQMVGNLDAGDYTLVSFDLTKTAQTPKDNNFNFDIHYTDNIGERRVVNMELPLILDASSITGASSMKSGVPGSDAQTNLNDSSNNLTYFIVIIIIVGLLGRVIKKYPKRTKKILNKTINGKAKSNSGEIPDWVKNAK